MSYQIDGEIDRFARLTVSLPASLKAERLGEHAVLVSPTADGVLKAKGKRQALTLMGITHGNEWAGIAVINGILALMQSGAFLPRIPVAFVLGNPWAARANKRFLERDLNRSFARKNPTAKEELRAAELAPILAASAYIVDFHQTSRTSDRAFFIFPYTAKSFAFAQAAAPYLSIVTHWGKPFSTEGMCTDEYVNSQGGVGISVELGQNGFDPYQIAVGVEAGLWAIQSVTEELAAPGSMAKKSASTGQSEPEIYTWAEIIHWPSEGLVELEEGWCNFKDVVSGQRLGTVDGRPLIASHAGKMLFPKYLTREEQAKQVSRPTELCRIMRRITRHDLPT